MLPSPVELRYFLEVAATLNMSRAAERLGLSQPTLTLAMQRLEASLGQPVLIRGKTGVRLTRAGERVAAQARFLLDEWHRLKEEVARDEHEVQGRYTLGCHPSVGLYTLPRLLPGLLRAFPGFEVRLVHDLSRRIAEDVISFKLDFGMVINPPPHPDLVLKHLLDDHVGLWVGPDETLEDTLLYEPDLLQSQAIQRQLTKEGVSFRRSVTSSSLEVLTEMVRAGAGVGLLPGRVATRVPGLRPWHPDLFGYHDRLYLVYRVEVHRSRAHRVIADHITEALAGDEKGG